MPVCMGMAYLRQNPGHSIMSQTPWWPTLWTAIGVYDCPELTQPGKVHRVPSGPLGSFRGGSEWQLLERRKGLNWGFSLAAHCLFQCANFMRSTLFQDTGKSRHTINNNNSEVLEYWQGCQLTILIVLRLLRSLVLTLE